MHYFSPFFIPRYRSHSSSSIPQQPVSPTQPPYTPNPYNVPPSPFSPLETEFTHAGCTDTTYNTQFNSEVVMPRPGSSKDLYSQFNAPDNSSIPRPGSSKDLAGMQFSMEGQFGNGEQAYSAGRHPSQSSSRSSGVASEEDPYQLQHQLTKSRTQSTLSGDFSHLDLFGSPPERECGVDRGAGGGFYAPLACGGGGGDAPTVSPTVWCLACHEDVVAAGCSDGSVEVRKMKFLLLFSPLKFGVIY